MNNMKITPFLFVLILFSALSCRSNMETARVRIRQANMTNMQVSTGQEMPKEIVYTNDKGEEVKFKSVDFDTLYNEVVSSFELAGVTVVAKAKNVAERNGKVNLDFIITVPERLINDKWQLQLQPVAYKPTEKILLDKILLSGADFAKMQKKGYLQYQAFLNSIIPDSLYLQELFDKKGGNTKQRCLMTPLGYGKESR